MEILIARVIFSVASLVLVFVPLYFIQHEVYKDGAFGRLGLGLISASSGLSWLEVVVGDADYWTMLLLFCLFMLSVAIFIAWHLIRWHRRVVQGRRDDPLPTRGDAYQLRRVG